MLMLMLMLMLMGKKIVTLFAATTTATTTAQRGSRWGCHLVSAPAAGLRRTRRGEVLCSAARLVGYRRILLRQRELPVDLNCFFQWVCTPIGSVRWPRRAPSNRAGTVLGVRPAGRLAAKGKRRVRLGL